MFRSVWVSVATLGVLLCGSAEGYVVNTKWGASAAVYYVNPQNGDVSEAAAIAAIRSAADAWSQQSRASFALIYGGTTNSTSLAYDDRSTVLFRDIANGSVLAVTYEWTSSGGYIVDADIVFYDGGFTFFTGDSGCAGGYFVEDVGTHEFGHALGLGHSSVGDATMVSGQGSCSTWKRSLAADDIAGVESLYPPATTTLTPPRAPTAVKMISGLVGPGGPTELSLRGFGGRLPNEAAPAEPRILAMVPVDVRRTA